MNTTKAVRPPSPQKKCEFFYLCKKTLWAKSKHTRCQNCRNAKIRYKDRPLRWLIDAYAASRLREARLSEFVGDKVAEIPRVRPLRQQ
jgi:hypothetical protein